MNYNEQTNTMETERLILRPFQAEDAETVVKLCNNINIYNPTVNIPFPYSLDNFFTWFNTHQHHFDMKTMYTYAIVLKETNELVGSTSLSHIKSHHRGELGYWIGEPYWNKGYATEAARALVHFGFTYTQLNRIFALYFLSNPQSAGVMKKIGMKEEGLLRQHFLKDGRFYDTGYCAIIKEDYKAHNL